MPLESGSPVTLNELAPDLSGEGRPLPCSTVARLVRKGPTRPDHLSVAEARALLLAAHQVYFSRFLCEVIRDPSVRDASGARDWHPATLPRRIAVHLGELQFPSPDSSPRTLRISPSLSEALAAFPGRLIVQALEWAPPIVGEPDARGRRRVVANALPALLAWHVLPDLEVRVKQLDSRAPANRTLGDVAYGIVEHFGPVVDKHMDWIVRAAPSPDFAATLSGRSRATCARLRKEKGVIPVFHEGMPLAQDEVDPDLVES